MYIINGQEFASTARAVDHVANNIDFHYLCEKGISRESYQHVVWAIRNLYYEKVVNLKYGESVDFEHVIITRK